MWDVYRRTTGLLIRVLSVLVAVSMAMQFLWFQVTSPTSLIKCPRVLELIGSMHGHWTRVDNVCMIYSITVGYSEDAYSISQHEYIVTLASQQQAGAWPSTCL